MPLCFEDASGESREAAARTTRLVHIYFPKLLLLLPSLAYSILFQVDLSNKNPSYLFYPDRDIRISSLVLILQRI